MNRIILISGGSDGLGYSIAKKLSVNNKVIIVSPNRQKVKRAADELGCDYLVANVSQYNQDQKIVANVIQRFKRVDVLINNAGLWIQGELEDNDSQRTKQVIDVNTLGTIYLTKSVIPFMKQQKEGLIINVISQAGLYGKAKRSVYNASKFAITGFTKSLELELKKYGVRVTGLYPGKLKTKMFEKMCIDKPMEDALDTEEVAKVIDFMLSLNKTTVFPEIGIKHIDN